MGHAHTGFVALERGGSGGEDDSPKPNALLVNKRGGSVIKTTESLGR